ncbi:MAG: hypothetical protein ACM3QS_03640 [Bacteroidota bacterium]
MPKTFEPEDLPVSARGGKSTLLADPSLLGSEALRVEHIDLEAAASTPVFEAAPAERFVYVIRGGGRAHVGAQAYPLAAESVLWLEQEDAFRLEADAGGLEVLLCRAPAGG